MNKNVPEPPHPTRRRQRLPGDTATEVAKVREEAEQIEAILQSNSYIPAIMDTSFLGGNDARSVRLQLDYLKPELLMREHGVEYTIVVFGGTRIPEPARCAAETKALEEELAVSPDDRQLARRLELARRVQSKSHYYDVAREFSHLVARAGEGPGDSRLVVVTGGGPGIMEAANRGAAEADAKSIGLNITLPREQFPNAYVSPELCFQFNYFALRKLHFMLRARALIAFPGGYGTLDELFETLTLIQTRKIKPLPVVLVGESFWRRAVDFDFLVEEGVIDPEDRELFWFAETAQDIWSGLQHWYERAGDTLLPNATASEKRA